MAESSANRRLQRYGPTLAALTAAGGAYSIQQTLVVPALPALQEELNTTTTWVTWLVTGFMLVCAVLAPLAGKLGDQYGKTRVLTLGFVLFFAGCLLAIFAWDIWSLIGARAIQGVGAATMPLLFGIARDEFPAEKVPIAVGLISATFAAGGGLGLIVSGLVIDNLSWRWLFVVGAASVLLALVLIYRYVPQSPVTTHATLDVPGAVLLVTGLVALLIGISEGSSWGWSSPRIIGLFVATVVLLTAWVLVERRVPEPMIDLDVFVHRPVLLTNIASVLTGFSMFGAFVLIPNLLHISPSVAGYGFGATSTQAAIYLLPSFVLGLVAGPAASVLARGRSAKVPFSLGLVLGGLGVTVIAIWHEHPWQIVVGMVLTGLGVPMSFAAMTTLIVEAVPPTETGVASGINHVTRTLGNVLGGQVGAAILAAYTLPGAGAPQEIAFTVAFATTAIAAFVGAVIALFVTPLRRPRRLGEPVRL